VFSRWRDSDTIEKLYTVDAAGGAGTLLLDSPGVSNVQATYSPNGKRIALLRADFTGAVNGIWVMYRDGTGLAPVPGTWGGWMPAWSPDGRWLAYSSNVTGTNQIYVVAPDGSGLTRVTFDGQDDTHPSWSPDGRSIVFAQAASCCDGGAQNGSVTRLEVGYLDLDVYWRPGDRRELLFHGVTSDGGRGLVVVDIDDPAAARLLVPEPTEESLRPNGWTPDGRRLVYTSVGEPYAETGVGLRLHVLDITTGSHVVIEAGHGHVSNDGSRILALNSEGPCVVSIEGGHCDLIARSSRAYEGGFASGVHWAPDDAWILVRDPARPGRAFLLDPSGDSQESPAWPESGGESWQRRAR